MIVIDSYFPAWREAMIHESSSAARGASLRLSTGCAGYIGTQYYPGQPSGSFVNGIRCENLEALSFEDNAIDLHISQDVFEHVFHPRRAFKEIARTLKPGGMHIFTVPLVNKQSPSQLRARMENDEIIHVMPELYHENPVGDGRSLVTVDWGYDICRHIFEASGLFTHIVRMDDISRGIRAEFIEVLVTMKPNDPDGHTKLP